MKHLIIILSLACASITINAQHRPPHDIDDNNPMEISKDHNGKKMNKQMRDEFRRQHQERKINFFVKEMGLSEAEKAIFKPLFQNFCNEMQASKRRVRHAKRSTKIENPSYDLVLEILEKEDVKQHNLKVNFQQELKKHFTPKQIYMLHEAENNFNRLLVKEIDKNNNNTKK